MRETILCMVAAVLFLIGCRGSDPIPEVSESSEVGVAKTPVDRTKAGSIRGTVRLDGVAPRMGTMRMLAVPNCAKMHATPPTSEEVLVGPDGALENVVVYLQGDFGQYQFPEPASPVTIDQKGCIYVPRVVAMTTKTTFRVLNSDSVTHNVNALAANNRRWNETQAIGGAPIEGVFARPEVSITLKCNLHDWMKTYIAVFDHPYFQVTGSDGSFRLGNVPPGTYKVMAWHERYGTQEQTITLGPNGEQAVTFVFSADRG